jgi:hypothetical protein
MMSLRQRLRTPALRKHYAHSTRVLSTLPTWRRCFSARTHCQKQRDDLRTTYSLPSPTRKILRTDQNWLANRAQWAEDNLYKRRTFQPAALSPQAALIKAKINKGTQAPDALLEAIEAGNASLEIVRVCLNAYYQSVQGLSVSRRKSTINKTPIAKAVLRYLLADHSRWTGSALEEAHFRARDHLAYFAVLEKCESYIFKWSQMELPTDAVETITSQLKKDYRLDVWRGCLFRSLITKLLEASEPPSGDRALRVFFQVLGARSTITRRHKDLLDNAHRLQPTNPGVTEPL